jgi:hypothetical protein
MVTGTITPDAKKMKWCMRTQDAATAFSARISSISKAFNLQSLPPGKVQVTPGTADMGPGYDIDGGGWQLVRRTSTDKWHTATDHCDGSEVYGTPSTKSDGPDTFSIKFDNIDYDEFLFASGDGKLWLITTPDAVGGKFNNQWYSNAQRSIIKASDNSKPHTAAWYNRQGQAEDPWISLSNHADSAKAGTIVYGENSYNRMATHTQLLRNHKGANVFVRKAPMRQTGPGDTSCTKKVCTDLVTYGAEEEVLVDIVGTRQSWRKAHRACGPGADINGGGSTFSIEFFYQTESGEQVHPAAAQLHV